MSSLIQIELSNITYKIRELTILIIELCNWNGELYIWIRKFSNSISDFSNLITELTIFIIDLCNWNRELFIWIRDLLFNYRSLIQLQNIIQ